MMSPAALNRSFLDACPRRQYGGRAGPRRRALPFIHGEESEHVLSKDWDHYLFKLGDDLASVYLDLGIAAAAPVAEHAHSVRISVALRQPAENGMSTDGEFEDLIALEDDLVSRVHGENAIYVGRLTTRGTRVFYLYAADADLLTRDVSAAIQRHPAYQARIGSQTDPEWSTYFDFLYPSLETYQRIQNRRLN